MVTTSPTLNWIASHTGGIADDALRDVYVRGKYRDVIVPNDASPSSEFDSMLSIPPDAKSWKTDLQRMGRKKEMRDPRFVIEHAGDPEYSLMTRSSDGQLLFPANSARPDTPAISRGHP